MALLNLLMTLTAILPSVNHTTRIHITLLTRIALLSTQFFVVLSAELEDSSPYRNLVAANSI